MRSAKKAYSDVQPYVRRAVSDEEVRDNLKDAFYAAKDIYEELFGGRSRIAVAQRVATDGDIHDNLKKISDDLRKATDRVQGKADHTARNFFMLLTGVVIGVLFNPFSGARDAQMAEGQGLRCRAGVLVPGQRPRGSLDGLVLLVLLFVFLVFASGLRVGRAARPGSRPTRDPCRLPTPA